MVENKDETLNSFGFLLERRKYLPSTVNSYCGAVQVLLDYYPNVQPSDITFAQISEFISFLVNRKKAAPASIRVYVSAFEIFFNSLLSKGFEIQSLKIPPRSRKIPEILTPLEIQQILNSPTLTDKTYLVLSVIYSAGLEISQALRISMRDVDFRNNLIKIRNSQGGIIREAVLADKLNYLLQNYLGAYRPEKWLFEGQEKGQQLSPSSVQKAFKRTIKYLNIQKDVTVRNLKYSYVKHMEMYGVPLAAILQELGISNSQTISAYSQMGVEVNTLSFSPLDMIVHEKSDSEIDTTAVEKSFASIQNEDEKAYLLEAIKCLKARASRAAVVFAWNAAIRNIQYRCLKRDVNSLNEAIRKHYRNANWVKNIEDFEDIRDRIVLEASHTLDVFTRREKNVLINCLDLRNNCGHPGTYMPDEIRVAAFLEDLFKIVFSKSYPYYYETNSGSPINGDADDEIPF